MIKTRAGESHSRSSYTHLPRPGESPSEAVIVAVAAVSGADPRGPSVGGSAAQSEMVPLATAIDLDALDDLFGDWPSRTSDGPDRVTFTYQQYLVTVHRHGAIEVAMDDERG